MNSADAVLEWERIKRDAINAAAAAINRDRNAPAALLALAVAHLTRTPSDDDAKIDFAKLPQAAVIKFAELHALLRGDPDDDVAPATELPASTVADDDDDAPDDATES